MLATSSSEDEDYDVKKKPGNNAVSGHNSNNNNNNKSFLNASGHAGPFTPQVQRSNNLGLANGADSNSMRSSFSASSENLSQGNATVGGPRPTRMPNNHHQTMRQASFKSTSSTSTTHGPAGSTHGSSLHPGGHSNLNAPKSPRHNRKNSRQPGGGRRGPGDNYSFSSSLNNGGGDYDSDNSDYQYENHYANQNNQYYQQSDDENENDNETVTMSHNEDGSNRSRQHENEQDKVNALALEAENEAMKEQELHKRKLQIYVLVCRCVSYPFIAKQPTDMVRRQLKITKQQLEIIKENFNTFLNNKMSSIEADEAFTNAVRSYYEVFLKSDRIAKMVASGGCTASDFRDVFKNNIEKRVRSLPEIDGLSKETVLTSWMTKFDSIYRYNEEHSSTNAIAARRHSRTHLNQGTSECILSKEQLYEMFQNLLGIKKFEHQLIFNASQLDNIDEQAATIRRELDSRMKQTENIQKQNGLMPKFVHKNMESTYIEELKQSISLLMNHLDNQPVGASESKLRLPKRPQASKNDHHHHDEPSLSKSEVQLSFAIEVVVMEVKGLKSLPPNRIVFCVMEVEGHGKLQTDQAEASRPIWDTSGDFKTQQPLPVIKVKLCMETQNILQDSKELGRVVLRPDPNFTRASAWYVMDKSNSSKFPDELKIKLTVRIDKPGNLKMCGWCYCMGKNLWKKWKKRYMCLVQVSTYTFALCSYMEKKSEPRELMTLDNFTVDYTDTDAELKSQGGRFFFSAVKEGDSVTFATDEENERQLWIQALYRATGQSHKPTPPSANSKAQSLSEQADAERAKKNGMEEYIQADPSKFIHNDLFKMLQQLTLEYRLNDPFCSLGWFSPGQIFVLDEYQARYGVRGCYRHLCYLNDLLDKAEQGYIIDPTLLHYSFAFCACHVHGNRPDGIGTVTNEEKVKFDEIKERLRNLLEYQITHFRYCFPFGRPEGALKQTLSLLERVLMKDIVTPVSPEEVKAVIRKCLEQAALVNYTRISQVAKVEDSLYNNETTPKKKIEDLIHLAELCIDLLQQNEEHHSELLREKSLKFLKPPVSKYQTVDEMREFARLKRARRCLYTYHKYRVSGDSRPFEKRRHRVYARINGRVKRLGNSRRVASQSEIDETDDEEIDRAFHHHLSHLRKQSIYLIESLASHYSQRIPEDEMLVLDESDINDQLNVKFLLLSKTHHFVSYPKLEFRQNFIKSFAWFCELLIEHEEIFWSLFAVDMDHVIEQQAPDCWDSFPLFQLLNDYLRNHTSLKDGRFHLHLQELFAPLVIRYIDLMESSIGQSIHKGFEKENWKNRGSGCATSEDMLWKLDALQAFIKDLHWPGEVLAEHLEKRLKEMASDMIEACATRVLKHFDSWLKKGIIILNAGTDYVIPQECCVMVNVIIDCKAQALKLCSLKSGDSNQYHTKIDEFLDRSLTEMKKQIVGKLISVLDGLLKKLSRYDEGTFFSSILSLTKPVNESGQSYVTFINLNLDVLRQKINDEIFVLDVFEQWYTEQVNMVCAWLSERLEISLHAYQLACLSLIVKKIRTNFELQGVSEKILEVKTYASILSRLNVEEANQALK